jgi:vanillate O-demethylase monooxygenase subunit
VLDADPEFRMQAVAADAALSHFRMTFEKLVGAERAAEAAEKAANPVAIPIKAPHQAGLRA